jgi:hypothetical protein
MEGRYTGAQLAIFGVEFLRFGWRMERLFRLDSFWEKWSWRLLFCWCDFKFGTTYHESGHGLRAKALGHDYQLLLDKSETKKSFVKEERFFKFFINKMLNLDRAACAYDAKFASESAHNQCIVFAGGVNGNTYLAERVSRSLYEHQDIYFLQGFSYLHNRLYLPVYALHAKHPGKDPYDVVECWKTLGIPVTRKDMALAGIVSFFLSGTTYSVLRATWKGDVESTETAPLEIGWLRLPDVFAYLTSQGVSYKLVNSCRIAEGAHLHFGVERVVRGTPMTEYHIGWKHIFGGVLTRFVHEATITFGQGLNAELSVSIPVFDAFWISVGVEMYSRTSLLGERHSCDFREEPCTIRFLSLSSRY